MIPTPWEKTNESEMGKDDDDEVVAVVGVSVDVDVEGPWPRLPTYDPAEARVEAIEAMDEDAACRRGSRPLVFVPEPEPEAERVPLEERFREVYDSGAFH